MLDIVIVIIAITELLLYTTTIVIIIYHIYIRSSLHRSVFSTILPQEGAAGDII